MPIMNTYPQKQSAGRKPIFFIAAITAAVVFLGYTWFFKPSAAPIVQKAVVVLKGDSPVAGTITFEQSSADGPVKISGEINNLDPSSQRGFHIHSLGDLSKGCLSTGSHYNPYDKTHGAPTDSVRHVGDLGNIESDEYGTATLSFKDSLISLNGPLSIVGRAVVVHAGTDDLGQGDNEESLKTGNAGGRTACGVIGLV
ncbi:superoxide dismutase [Suillus clintonianus]|uniref:superoxide dismutase n=1 Tax=Suillus clintonianus TaxID=1904413 RepID=UPI001B860B9F|nr:superoxide dismutase [Suillus clintonianus]KAG2129485.1 superoxide dismutase [Suillus clintonianus]